LSPPLTTTGAVSAAPTGPTADVALPFDNLVGQQLHRIGDGETARLGRLHSDDELEFGRLLDREVDQLCPAQNLVDMVGGPPEQTVFAP